MDQISRIAMVAVCLFIDRRQTISWFCGGLAAGLGLGAYFKLRGQNSPRIAEIGAVCGHGIIESASGRKLNPFLARLSTVFFFWVCAQDHHHSGPYVKTASAAEGYGLGMDLVDWLSGNVPETVTVEHACHKKHT